jgi:hypothetical protein
MSQTDDCNHGTPVSTEGVSLSLQEVIKDVFKSIDAYATIKSADDSTADEACQAAQVVIDTRKSLEGDGADAIAAAAEAMGVGSS